MRRTGTGRALRPSSPWNVVWHNPAGLDGGGAERLAVAVIDSLSKLEGVIGSR